MAMLAFPPTAAAREIDLNVMTFNVWKAEDDAEGRKQIVEVIRQSGADLIGLQEMNGDALQEVAKSLGYYAFDQHLDSEAILSRYRIVSTAPQRFGVEVEVEPGCNVWLFNTHLHHAPYGPYQLNGITYNEGRLYNPADSKHIEQVIADQVAARGDELQSVLRSVHESKCLTRQTPVFLTGDFNEPSHLDWTPASKRAGIHVAIVNWPTSSAVVAAGFRDSFRSIHPDVAKHVGRTWSPLYPAGYANHGDDARLQKHPVAEPQDRIDFIYFAGASVTAHKSLRSGPTGRDDHEELELPGYPSDHNAVTTRFVINVHDE